MREDGMVEDGMVTRGKEREKCLGAGHWRGGRSGEKSRGEFLE